MVFHGFPWFFKYRVSPNIGFSMVFPEHVPFKKTPLRHGMVHGLTLPPDATHDMASLKSRHSSMQPCSTWVTRPAKHPQGDSLGLLQGTPLEFEGCDKALVVNNPCIMYIYICVCIYIYT